jgi:hypothetical protein
MARSNDRRARLSIDVAPDLRRRIKIAADLRDLSVRDYVEAALRQSLDENAEGEHAIGRRLTAAEQQRGLRALAELERLDRDLLEQRGGRRFSPSWELLDEARDE